MSFTWQGRTYDKVNEIIDAALALEGAAQAEFVEAFCASGKYARTNIGYISGYYSQETRVKICQVFRTSHPIFGDGVLSDAEVDAKSKAGVP